MKKKYFKAAMKVLAIMITGALLSEVLFINTEASPLKTPEEEMGETEAAAETVTEAASEAASEAVSVEAAEAESEESTEAETEDPAMAAAREKAMADAQAFLESVKGADADAFSAAATEASQQSNVSNGSWTFGTDSTYPDAQIITATEGLADGTLVENVIQVGDVYYVVYVTSAFDREATDERKEEIVEERKQARIESLLETWEGGSEEAETSDETEAAPVQAADFVIDQEAFAALSFDYLLYQEEETETALEEMITEEAVTEGLTEGGTEGVQ